MIFGQFHRTMLTIHNFFVFMNSIDVMLQIISWYLDTTMLTINVVIWCRISVSCFIFSGRIRLIENFDRAISFWREQNWKLFLPFFYEFLKIFVKDTNSLFFILLGIFKNSWSHNFFKMSFGQQSHKTLVWGEVEKCFLKRRT